jgi:mRNA interferase MazF
MIRGAIWIINLDPTIGDEIQKSRPAVIVNNNSLGILNLRIIAPITGWDNSFNNKSWFVKLEPDRTNGLTKDSAVDVFQIRSVSTKRFHRKIGEVSLLKLEEIENKLIAILDLNI